MNGVLLNPIQEVFRTKFEKRCLSLLNLAYLQSVFTNRICSDLEEESISANLIDLMKESEDAQAWNIDIVPEYRIYKKEHLSGLESPKKASRIDFRFSTFASNRCLEYFMEAKNLAEKNWRKSGNTADTIALDLQKRYIKTGIKKFLSGEYPRGCLLGYVLQGNPINIVSNINRLIVQEGLDCLVERRTNLYIESFYFESQSFQNGQKIIVKQILLDYSS